MPISIEAALERIRERAEDDPDFAETLLHLAEEDLDDPFARVESGVLDVARGLSRRRRFERAEELRRTSLTTPEVVDLLASVSDRKGVDRRRRRGAVLGVRVGRDTYHPAWQFDQRRRDTYEGLPTVLAALREVAVDGVDADAIATAPEASADGRSIAELLAAGEVEAAVAAVRLAGDQS